MTKEQRDWQKRASAILQADINARKSKNVVKAGANLASQWGRVVNNEQRLIDNGHYMKSGENAQLSYLRDQYKKMKEEQNSELTIVLVKRG